MDRARSFTIGIALTLTVVPLAAATWNGKGTWEPDTSYDTTGWMTLAPDTSSDASVNLVYFNGFHGDYRGTLSANSALVGSSLYHGMSYSFYAMLGVWKDCNRDGYVGFGDAGQWEYRSELLAATSAIGGPGASICPPSAAVVGQMPPHNDGKWVHEWIPISWKPWNTPDPNGFDLTDNSSRVWADYGLLSLDQEPFGNCWLFPHPRGTYHGTGWFLQEMDGCWTGHQLTDDSTLVVKQVNGDNLGAGQISFSDHPDDQHNSASKLNQANPWGEESDASMVNSEWDCSGGPLVSAPRDPTTGQLHDPSGTGTNLTDKDGYFAYVNVSQPGSPSLGSSGSPAGTANATGSGLDQCSRRDSPGGGRGGALATAPYSAEGDVTQTVARTQPFVDMTPRTATRPTMLVSEKAAGSYVNVTAWQDTQGPDAPATPNVNGTTLTTANDIGTGLTSNDGFWQDAVAGHLAEPNFFDWHLAPTFAWYNTYYAFVSPAAVAAYHLTLPGGTATGTYGAEACGSSTTGFHNYAYPTSQPWDCDATHWWRDASNTFAPICSPVLGPQDPGRTCHAGSSGKPFETSVGAPYNLRDVDCYDQNVGPTRGLSVGADDVTTVKCARPT